MFYRVCGACVVFLISACAAFADSPTASESPAKIDLDAIVTVEPGDNDEGMLRMTQTRFVSETLVREVNVTKFRNEQRTREITVDGQTKTVNYTVAVPFVMTVAQNFEVTKPMLQQSSVTPDQFLAFDLDGKPISPDTLKTMLAKKVTAFLISTDAAPALTPIQRGAIKEDVIFLRRVAAKP